MIIKRLVSSVVFGSQFSFCKHLEPASNGILSCCTG